MKSLPMGLGTQTPRSRCDSNERIVFQILVRRHARASLNFRFDSSFMPTLDLKIPSEAPVMVLSNALLFPHVLLPLHIFEQRYRAMLEWALEHDRVFCIALRRPDAVETGASSDFYHVAGLGLIRACVGA